MQRGHGEKEKGLFSKSTPPRVAKMEKKKKDLKVITY